MTDAQWLGFAIVIMMGGHLLSEFTDKDGGWTVLYYTLVLGTLGTGFLLLTEMIQ